MVGKTHALGGSVFALGSYLLLKQTNIIDMDMDTAAQVFIILPYSIWAAKIPDLDQDNLDVALENPINLAIQKLFNLIGAGHRSFKSHVYPAVIMSLLTILGISGVNLFHAQHSLSINLYCMVTLGISMGLISHALLDMCTKGGLKHRGKRYAFVPKLDTFKTGSVYEKYVRLGLYALNVILLGMLLV